MVEPIYIYHTASSPVEQSTISEFFQSHHLSFTTVDLNQNPQAREDVSKWSDGREDVTLVIRVGDKIRALFFNPAVVTLSRMFEPHNSADSEHLRSLPITVFSADWCPDCRRMEWYLDQHQTVYSKINIELVPGTPEKVMRWSGGRRVIPTIRIGENILLFNPGPQVIGALLGFS